jgi:hypothetical protein
MRYVHDSDFVIWFGVRGVIELVLVGWQKNTRTEKRASCVSYNLMLLLGFVSTGFFLLVFFYWFFSTGFFLLVFTLHILPAPPEPKGTVLQYL